MRGAGVVRKTGSASISASKRQDGVETTLVDETMHPTRQFKAPEETLGAVTIGAGATIKVADFENVKVFAQVTIPTHTKTDDQISSTAQRASDLVDTFLQQEQQRALDSFKEDVDKAFEDDFDA